ncbi:MAG TPA: hydrogen peroxide-inducible genes activator [Candidatus Omnitrophota bacterium]|nr:hydrogen peroxide-inducible genes activator [Candidatus Omnitrophota bacterium]
MDIQQLRYVVALSQELHFQRAAQKVHVTQPTLSQGVQNLEKELGAVLFERSSHKVQITAAGKKFLTHAVSALDQIQKGVLEIRKDTEDINETVRLGVIPTICPYLMPKVILQLKKTAPHLVLELFEETTSVLLDFLKSGKLDLGILALPVKDRGIVGQGLATEPFYLAMTKRHRLAAKEKVTRSDLANEKMLILQEGHCFGQQTLDFCKIKRKDQQVIFQGSSLTSVLQLAAVGEGVTFVPEMAVAFERSAGLVYVPFASPQPKREIGVVWRLTEPLFQAQHFLMETVRQILNEKK